MVIRFRWRRWTVGSVAVALAVVVLHLPFAERLLGAGRCPIPRAAPARIQAAQALAFRGLRGTTAARARPALGFGLAVASRADVQAWARDHRIDCESRREGALLICVGVPGAAVPETADGTYDEVAFGFRLDDSRLFNVTALRTGLSPRAAAANVRQITERLDKQLGAPAKEIAGDPAVVAYRHSDYLAEVSAMSLRGRGHAIREHYMSTPE